MRVKPRFLIGGGLIAAAIIYLIATAIRNTAEYYLTVPEVAAAADTLKGQPLRIAGRVKPASVSWDPSTLRLVFTIVPIPSASGAPSADGAKSHAGTAAASVDGVEAPKAALRQPANLARTRGDRVYALAGEVKTLLDQTQPPNGASIGIDPKYGPNTGPPSFVVICVGQPKPDMFAENRDVIVEGKLTSSGTVAAEQVLTSCPSKYTPESKK
jgi:cytochrome c-type biogenesis protein CcmE